jgi:protocatechuate 3,4-dioxygenase beta subunit
MKNAHLLLKVWILLQAFTGAVVFGQFESATLTGVVTDSSGKVIPGVVVKAISEGTSVETSSTTNGEGRYNFPTLRPGSYRVVAAMAGFKQHVSSGVVLQVN